MSNKRVLLLTGTTDMLRTETETDNTMEEVFDLTLPSKLRYVKKHGYDILSMRSFGGDKLNRFTELDLGFLRVLRAYEMLQWYDAVMWIDADSIITNEDYTIDDFTIDETHSFYASWDWGGRETFSTGNFIITNAEYTKSLFQAFLDVGRQVIDGGHWGWEQTTLNHIYKNPQLKPSIKVLEHKFLGSIPSRKMFLGIWDGRPEPQFPWSKDSFLVHLTGIPNSDRINVAKTTFIEYL